MFQSMQLMIGNGGYIYQYEYAIMKIENKYSKIAVALLFVFMCLGLWMVYEFYKNEHMREMNKWRAIVATNVQKNAADIEKVLFKRQRQLKEISENNSLKLYLSEYKNSSVGNNLILSAQRTYVNNLLSSAVDRFGINDYGRKNRLAYLTKPDQYGLMVFDSNKRLLMSTGSVLQSGDGLGKYLNAVHEKLENQFVDIYLQGSQQPVYGFIEPVYSIHGPENSRPVGSVLVLLDPDADLYSKLENNFGLSLTEESILVRRSEHALVYLSPLKNNAQLLYELADNNNTLAESYAFHNPGSFKVMRDYMGEEVLVTARKINNTKWAVVQKISLKEALGDFYKHIAFVTAVLILAIILVCLIFVLVWKHSSNSKMAALSVELEKKTSLLNYVANNIHDYVILLNDKEHVVFINDSFSRFVGVETGYLCRVHLANVIGKQAYGKLKAVGQDLNNVSAISLDINNCKREYHVAISYISHEGAVADRLYVLHDISDLKQDHKKQQSLSTEIIETIVKAADLHDPYCAYHSQRTKEVVHEIGMALNMSESQLKNLEMAALLANLGKLFVPENILTKSDKLTSEEIDKLHHHIEYSTNILSDLRFDGPVLDIISQKNERLDGSGYPAGLHEPEILPEAKVLAVANAFVAMTSARAYRRGRDVEEALDIILKQSVSQYDRQVVAALFHIAENKTQWKDWKNTETVN